MRSTITEVFPPALFYRQAVTKYSTTKKVLKNNIPSFRGISVPRCSSMCPEEVTVAIVGGGLAGLALKIGLEERGIDAHVFEAADKLRTDSGTVVTISLNGNIGLEGVSSNLSKDVEKCGCVVNSISSVVTDNGRIVRKGTYDRSQSGMVVVGWRAIQEVFASKVNKESIHCGHRFLNFVVNEDGVDATFEVKNESSPHSEKTVKAKLLIGADGIRSAVRKNLVGDKPRYLRCLNWNAIIPNPDRSVIQGHDKDQICIFREESTGFVSFLMDAGQSYSFWNVRKWDRDLALSEEYGVGWGGFGRPGAKERALSWIPEFPDFDSLRSAVSNTAEELIFERRIMDRLPLDTWSDASKRVLIIGDAAHAMCPSAGEGARQAFEDADQLCNILGRVGGGLDDREAVVAAIQKFESLRIPRLQKVQSFSAEDSGLPVEERLRPEVRNLTPEERQLRSSEFMKWIRSYPDNIAGDPNSTFWK